eukprot:m.38814 g.38814  ORF g.38814 m.38814 type:complete len:55 (+) comp14675_c1_seq1:248-412(+)
MYSDMPHNKQGEGVPENLPRLNSTDLILLSVPQIVHAVLTTLVHSYSDVHLQHH